MKVHIINLVNGREYKGDFPNREEADAWVKSQTDKGMQCPWGKPEYAEVMEKKKHPNPRAQFNQTIKVDDGDKKVTMYSFLIPVEYEITFEDNSEEIELMEVVEKRKKEYPSIDQIIDIFMDHGPDSLEMQELRNKRLLIKEKYPKPRKKDVPII